MDGRAWQITVHGVTKSQTDWSDWACTHSCTKWGRLFTSNHSRCCSLYFIKSSYIFTKETTQMDFVFHLCKEIVIFWRHTYSDPKMLFPYTWLRLKWHVNWSIWKVQWLLLQKSSFISILRVYCNLKKIITKIMTKMVRLKIKLPWARKPPC